MTRLTPWRHFAVQKIGATKHGRPVVDPRRQCTGTLSNEADATSAGARNRRVPRFRPSWQVREVPFVNSLDVKVERSTG